MNTNREVDVDREVARRLKIAVETQKVKIYDREECDQLMAALKEYISHALSDAQEYIDKKLQAIQGDSKEGTSSVKQRADSYKEMIRKFCLKYCEIYFSRLEMYGHFRDENSGGFYHCCTEILQPDLLPKVAEETIARVTEANPSSKKKRTIISFPFKSAS